MEFSIRYIFVCLLAIGAWTSVTANPWTIPQGTLYLGHNNVWTSFTKQSADGGKIAAGPGEFLSTGLSVDIGILDNLNISLFAPYAYVSRKRDVPAYSSGWGDGRAGLKFRILDEEEGFPFTLSFKAEHKGPLSGYPVDRGISIGDGQHDNEARLLLGRSFELFKHSTFAILEVAYVARDGRPPNDVLVDLGFGVALNDIFSISLFVSSIDAQGGIGLGSLEFFGITEDAIRRKFIDFIFLRGQGQSIDSNQFITELQTESNLQNANLLQSSAVNSLILPFSETEEDIVKLGIGLSIRLDQWEINLSYARNVRTRNSSIDQQGSLSISRSFDFLGDPSADEDE